MELRVLQYYLAVAREQSISGAAEYLHLSQPTLSRQLRDMEEELGKQLFIRGNRKITLTEEGMILRKRAEEILDLVKKAENEIMQSDTTIGGDIYVGTGETEIVRHITRAVHSLQQEHPNVHLHIVSGDSATVLEQLDKGLIDFGLTFGAVDVSRYEHLAVPGQARWGVLMLRDSELAAQASVTAADLSDKPLIVSRQSLVDGGFRTMMKRSREEMNVVATYNLLYNGSLMVSEGMGYALCIDGIINTSGDSNLCFRPLEPPHRMSMSLVWKKYQVFTKAAEKFLEVLRTELGEI